MYKDKRQGHSKSVGFYKDQEKISKNNKRNRYFLMSILLSWVFLFSIMAFNFTQTYQTARNDVFELCKSSSIQNARNMELFFLRHEDVLITTAKMLEHTMEKKSTGRKDVERLLREISVEYDEKIYSKYTNTKFTGIYAAIDGVLVHGLKKPEDLPKGYNPLERQWYKEAVEGKGNVIFGEPYKDIYTPYKVMTATKLLKDGETVVAMDITLDDLQFAGGQLDVSVMMNGNEHIYGYGFVLTNKGIVMAHSDKSQQDRCYDDPESPMYDVFQQIKYNIKKGIDFFETEIDGLNYRIFPQKLSNGWYVVTLTDLDDIRATMSDFSEIITIGTAMVMLLALLYCILLTRSHIKSERLTKNLSNALTLATEDKLTGQKNRTAYDMRIRELQERINTESDTSFAFVMMDLNDLKYVNDHYGHAAGDEYIRNSSRLIQRIIPSEVFRIGGDEFAMFLVGEIFEQRDKLFEDLKQEVTVANLSLIPNVDKPSIAIGMAVHIVGNDDDINILIRKADNEMYYNKSSIKKKRREARNKKWRRVN